jgi:type III secretion protein J
MGGGSIVPSRAAEHARMVAGTAGDLERSLREVDGVLSARVHLAVPPKDPLATTAAAAKPTASVLLRHRGASPPMAAKSVQALVAGAVPGLAPEDVAVVATPSPEPPRAPERELAQFGPIQTTRGSLGWARGIAAGAIALSVALVAVILALWSRLRRAAEQAAPDETS